MTQNKTIRDYADIIAFIFVFGFVIIVWIYSMIAFLIIMLEW